MNYAGRMKSKLDDIIVESSMNPDFIRNPDTDFTRMRKLDYATIFHSLIAMGGQSLNAELLELYSYSIDLPTSSAFVQARGKILPKAFEHVFRQFTKTLNQPKKYKGYKLLSADGSAINFCRNPLDSTTYVLNRKHKGHNALLITCVYDLLNHVYLDTVITPHNENDERKALKSMLPNMHEESILILDRGYESYNLAIHMEKTGLYYLMRVRDIGSNGILSALEFETNEIDENITVNISNSQKLEYKALPNFRYSSSVRFDHYTTETPVYQFSFRVVRIKSKNNEYESFITNLPQSFSVGEIKDLYKIRWGIETSFRELKYSIGLTNFHAKKKDSIIQEIYARLTLHNFCKYIVQNTVLHKNTTHQYQINFARAVQVCRKYLRTKNTVLLNVEALISKFLSVIRSDRTFKRNIRKKGYVSFNYRVA